MGDAGARASSSSTRPRTRGHRVHPQSATQQLQVFFALADTFLFDEMPAFRDMLTLPVGPRASACCATRGPRRDSARAVGRHHGSSHRLRLGQRQGGTGRPPSRVGRAPRRRAPHALRRGRSISTRSSTRRSPRTSPPSSRSAARWRTRRRIRRPQRSSRHPLTPPGQQRRRRAPLVATAASTTRRGCSAEYVPDVTAARVSGRAARRRSPRRSTASPTAASCAPVRSPTSWCGIPRGSAVGRRRGGSRTSRLVAVASSSTPRAISRWSSTVKSCAATASTPARARAACCDREPELRGARLRGVGTARRS